MGKESTIRPPTPLLSERPDALHEVPSTLLLEFAFEIRGAARRAPMARLWVDASQDDVPADDAEVVLSASRRVDGAAWHGVVQIRQGDVPVDEVWCRLRLVADPGLAWVLRVNCTVGAWRRLVFAADGVIVRRKTNLAVTCKVV